MGGASGQGSRLSGPSSCSPSEFLACPLWEHHTGPPTSGESSSPLFQPSPHPPFSPLPSRGFPGTPNSEDLAPIDIFQELLSQKDSMFHQKIAPNQFFTTHLPAFPVSFILGSCLLLTGPDDSLGNMATTMAPQSSRDGDTFYTEEMS